MVLAHRGACGYRPEHTRAAFELAIAQGADGIEVDVVPSRDGVLVVRHEPELSATTDVATRPEFAARRRTGSIDGRIRTGWFVEDFRWAELRRLRATERFPGYRPSSAVHDGDEPVLRLTDVLDIAAAAGVVLVIEVKHPTHFEGLGFPMAELLVQTLAAAPRLPAMVVESFEKTVLRRLAELGVPSPLIYLLENRGAAPDEAVGRARPHSYRRELADLTSLADLSGIAVRTTEVVDGLAERAAAAGLQVWAWTLRPENRFLSARFRTPGSPAEFGDWRRMQAELIAAGVTGLLTDHPDLTIELRNRERGRPASASPAERGAASHPLR